MTDATQNDLLAFIDKMVEQKTFGLDALKAISELRDKAEALNERLAVEKRNAERRAEDIRQRDARLASLESKVAALALRETAVADREAKATELEKRVAVAEAKHMATVETAAMFLRNSLVRESVQKTIVVPGGIGGSGSAGYTMPVTETKTTRAE